MQLTVRNKNRVERFIAAVLVCATVVSTSASPGPTAKIEKPRPVMVTGGICRILSNGTFGGKWGPSSLPILTVVIGPDSETMYPSHGNKAKFTGPGTYKNEFIVVFLGKTAAQDSYTGLGTVIINADNHSGRFALNDGSVAGHFDCGVPPQPPV